MINTSFDVITDAEAQLASNRHHRAIPMLTASLPLCYSGRAVGACSVIAMLDRRDEPRRTDVPTDR